jgi:hypothetical protein
MASETTMVADEKVYQAEQMTSDDSGDEIVIETDTITEYDTIPGTVSAPTSEKDLVLGLEAILALGALGTGLAWIYTRRRVI